MKKVIKVAEEFSKYPAGRFKSDGPFTAEHLRDDFIIPALRNYEEVELYMNGVRGYPASFLEEVFGGLIRMGISKDNIGNKLKIVCDDFELVREIQAFIYEAQQKVEYYEKCRKGIEKCDPAQNVIDSDNEEFLED